MDIGKRDDADLCRICSISNVRKRIWTAESRKDIGYGYGKQWHCNNKCIDREKWKVIAWQELPETYKGE